jgi:RNA polymerase primary sigma factor
MPGDTDHPDNRYAYQESAARPRQLGQEDHDSVRSRLQVYPGERTQVIREKVSVMALSRKKTMKQQQVSDPFRDDNELAYFRKCRKGNEEARDALVKSYEAWVVNISHKYHSCFQGIDMNELIAEGNRGLLEALYRFDEKRGVKFSTYAWFWIVKNIQDYISSNLSLIEVPRKISADLRKIVNSMNEEVKKGKVPSFEQIARKIDIDADTIRELLSDRKNLSRPVSLDKFLDEDDQVQTLGDIIEDKRDPALQEILENLDDEINIASLLEQLLPVEQKVIKLRFGFEDNQFHSLKEVGEKLKISSTKIKDIESMAIIKLKRFLSAER